MDVKERPGDNRDLRDAAIESLRFAASQCPRMQGSDMDASIIDSIMNKDAEFKEALAENGITECDVVYECMGAEVVFLEAGVLSHELEYPKVFSAVLAMAKKEFESQCKNSFGEDWRHDPSIIRSTKRFGIAAVQDFDRIEPLLVSQNNNIVTVQQGSAAERTTFLDYDPRKSYQKLPQGHAIIQKDCTIDGKITQSFLYSNGTTIKPMGDDLAPFRKNPKSILQVTSPEVLASLADSSHNAEILFYVGGNPHTAPETLAAISTNPSDIVRSAVAQNPNTPHDALAGLVNDTESFVRVSVAWNPSTPHDLLAELADDACPNVRAVAKIVEQQRTEEEAPTGVKV